MTPRIIRFLPVIVFLALAVTPAVLIGVNGPWPGSAMPEFRPLRPFPPNLAPNTFRRIGDWFSDRIGLRYPLLKLGIEVTARLWQPRVIGGVIVGRGPWLFWSDDETNPTALMADVRGRLRLPDETAVVIDNILRAAKANYSACGKQAFALVAPNKQSIYPEQMDAGRAGYLPSRFDGLLEKLSPTARAMVIDPRPAMRAAKASHPVPLFFHTDTHWNDLGTYHAYRAVVETLVRANAIHRPERAAFENYELSVRPFEGGDMATRILYLPWRFSDVIPTLEPKPPLRSAVKTEEPTLFRYVNPDGEGRLVIHGDSFGPPLAAFLARHFAEVILLPRTSWTLAFDGALTAKLRADVTLLETAERFLPSLAASPRNLEQTCRG